MKYKDHKILVDEFSKGERIAFDHLFSEFHNALYYFAERIINDREEAKDIVITSFTKLWNRREHFDSFNNIRAFLYITTRNACFDFVKFRQRKTKFEESFGRTVSLNEETNAEQIQIEAELLRKICKEIDNLPDRYRRVFQLTYFEGRKAKEVAEILKLSVTNVTTLRSRGMQLLRIALSDVTLLILYILLVSSCLKGQASIIFF